MTERMRDMTERYGEACTFKVAGQIINRSVDTISNMVKDGRLRTACEGTMIDVRSLCEYIERPAEINERARVAKMRKKAGVECRFVVT